MSEAKVIYHAKRSGAVTQTAAGKVKPISPEIRTRIEQRLTSLIEDFEYLEGAGRITPGKVLEILTALYRVDYLFSKTDRKTYEKRKGE